MASFPCVCVHLLCSKPDQIVRTSVAEKTYVNSKWQHEKKSGRAEAEQTTANIGCPLTQAMAKESVGGRALLGVVAAASPKGQGIILAAG